ncbi:PPE family protein [Mycobacterium lacus]|nr:PPE family protein [Mycobacterium lacus]ORW00071.1 hypothetical protein AWC15_09300 [Mycobacterium lacus]
MYAGPGSGPLLAAAAAWDGLAAELALAAAGYSSVISELTSAQWVGPASAAMVAAVAPYAAWLGTTAQRAEQAGTQARAAAAAYELAFAMTVPPPVIAANRALLMTLITTNFFGQNTPAIAATEAQYAEMWAQDAAAMYAYASSSATASVLTPFMPAPETTNPAAVVLQAAAVGQAVAAPAESAASTASMTPQLVAATAVAEVLRQLSSPASMPWYWEIAQWIEAHLPDLTVANRVTIVRILGQSYFFAGISQYVASIVQQMIPGTPGGAGDAGSSVLDWWGPSLASGFGAGHGTAAGAGGAVVRGVPTAVSQYWAYQGHPSAALGKGGSIGSLRVPEDWAFRVRMANPTAMGGPVANNVTEILKGPTENALLRGIQMSGAGQATGGGYGHKYGFRLAVMQRPPFAG